MDVAYLHVINGKSTNATYFQTRYWFRSNFLVFISLESKPLFNFPDIYACVKRLIAYHGAKDKINIMDWH